MTEASFLAVFYTNNQILLKFEILQILCAFTNVEGLILHKALPHSDSCLWISTSVCHVLHYPLQEETGIKKGPELCVLLTKPFPSPAPASPSTCTVSPQQSALEIRTKPSMSCTPCDICHLRLPGTPHHSCSRELCRSLLGLRFPPEQLLSPCASRNPCPLALVLTDPLHSQLLWNLLLPSCSPLPESSLKEGLLSLPWVSPHWPRGEFHSL